jgi:hypothetical protein
VAVAAMTRCAKCNQEYPADTLVLTVQGRVCASCEMESKADSGQVRGDVWRIIVGPFIIGIGTLTGALFAFAFGPMLIPIFYGSFGLIGIACAWQAGTWGLFEVLDRENGRPIWGVGAMLTAVATVGWSAVMEVLSVLVLAGFGHG